MVNTVKTTMQKLVLEKKGSLALVDEAVPEPGSNEEIVCVELAGIGGSEYLGFANPGIRQLPNAMAHGIVGTTVEGRRVAVYPISGCGQCSWCSTSLPQLCDHWNMIGVHSDGGFSQQIAVPGASLIELPESLCWERAAFIEPFANSINAVDVANVSDDSSVAIIGAGGLGLGLVAACTEIGCKEIFISDPSTSRTRAAEYLGAESIQSTSTDEFDFVFDTVGTSSSRAKSLEVTKKMGTCVLLGFAEPQMELQSGSLIRTQKHIIGAFAFSMDQFKRAVVLAERSKANWVKNLTFSEVQIQLEKFLSGDFTTVKAVLRPHDHIKNP